METQPTFAERTAALKDVAFDLKHAAEIVLAEAQRMEAAQGRFAARNNARQTTKANRPGRAG